MNKDWILFHLREASEELLRTIGEFETASNYSEAEFRVAAEHIYNHLNTAWNSRNADPTHLARHSEREFFAWRDFPPDITMRGE
jgi:hypothetical protein